jgi:DNA-binding MarR family transcriptional regulator
MQAAAHDVEWSARMLLKCLANEGPMRASAISDHLQSDPSTVSRQVAALVKDGLLERRADPADGRASLLVLTPKADAVLADHDRIRLDFFAGMLGDWSDADLRTFAAMLDRFTTDYENANHDWLAGRIANRDVPAGGTN